MYTVSDATGIKKCYFIVWTSHGYAIDDIIFDAEYLNNLFVCIFLQAVFTVIFLCKTNLGISS